MPLDGVNQKLNLGVQQQTFTNYVVLDTKGNSARDVVMAGAKSISKTMDSAIKESVSSLANLFSKEQLQKAASNPHINNAAKFAIVKMFVSLFSKNQSLEVPTEKKMVYDDPMATKWKAELDKTTTVDENGKSTTPQSKEFKLGHLADLKKNVQEVLDQNEIGENEQLNPETVLGQYQALAKEIQSAIETLKKSES